MGRKSLKKKRKEHPEKKEQWVRQLIPHFQKNGLRNFTMDDVSKLLNLSKATVYKYFKSREEIVEMGVAIKLEEISHFRDKLMDKHAPYLDRYFNSLEYLTAHISDITNIFLSDLKHLYPKIWESVNAFIEFALEILQDYYSEGISKGLLEDVDPALMVMSDRFFLQALSDPDFLISHQLTINEAFQKYFRMKFFGIVKDKK